MAEITYLFVLAIVFVAFNEVIIVADIENNNVYLHSVLYKNYIPLFLKNLHTFLDKAK